MRCAIAWVRSLFVLLMRQKNRNVQNSSKNIVNCCVRNKRNKRKKRQMNALCDRLGTIVVRFAHATEEQECTKLKQEYRQLLREKKKKQKKKKTNECAVRSLGYDRCSFCSCDRRTGMYKTQARISSIVA